MALIRLPIRLWSVANLREHWAKRAKRAREHRALACFMVRSHVATHPLPVTVHLTRIAPKALDDDNLQSAFKAIRDGVADAYGIDDRDPRISFRYAQRKGKPKDYAVEIELVKEGETNEKA